MADRPLTLRRLLASHRDHRANLLGGVCRRCARARRIREPLRHGLGGRRLPPPPAPIPHRLRPHVEFSRALADANIVGGMQNHASRNANCCEVEWARTSASSASRCAGKTITGSAASQGIANSPLSFRFVMPQRRRFDSWFVAGKQPRSYYLRTFTQGGVATSARRYYE